MGSLNIDQTGSSYEYVKALAELSSKYPQVWTTYYTGSGKKSASKRLAQFLSRGSQGGPPNIWVQISRLLWNVLPLNLISEQNHTRGKPVTDEVDLQWPILEALHDGISHKGEYRSGQNEAWQAYLLAAELVQRSNSTLDQHRRFIERSLFPIIEQYINPIPERSDWTLEGSDQLIVCLKSIQLILHGSTKVLNEVWQLLSRTIVEHLKTSSPEQSKDYAKSQDTIASEVRRWYSFQNAILRSDDAGIMRPILNLTCLEELRSAIDVITARNGKPYSTAVALLSMVQLIPEITLHQNETREALIEFAQDKVPDLLLSPSSKYLIDFLCRLNDDQELKKVSQKAMESLLSERESDAKCIAIQSLVNSPWIEQDTISDAIGRVVKDNLHQALRGKDECWNLVSRAMENPSLPSILADDLLSTITNSLSVDDSVEAAICGLNLVLKHNRQGLKRISISKQGPILLSRLLFLAESSKHDIAQNARNLNTSIQAIVASDESHDIAHQSMIEIINEGLNTTEADSLS